MGKEGKERLPKTFDIGKQDRFGMTAQLLPGELRRFVVSDPANVADLAGRLAELLRTGRDFEQIARAAAEAHPWSEYSSGLLNILGEVTREMRE